MTRRRPTPTALDAVSPFDSTTQRSPDDLASLTPRAPVLPHASITQLDPLVRETQLSVDPPTALVRRDSFRELPPGTGVGDNYEIDARIGAGAMGEVYAAHHVRLGKRVAIKVIGRRLSEDASAIERFAMEAKTLAQVQHPAIVAVDHVGELADGRAYFVMEFLRGESLFARLQRGRLPLPEALRILDQMARGLEAAHQGGVTHRDLKPENTFLVHLFGEEPTVKLLDFGLAKLRPLDDQRAERTQSGVTIGTPMYMSPEQARGPDVDYRTDIYALGCVAYELVLGQPPFPLAKTAPELYAAHLHAAPPLPRSIWPEIPPQLDLVLFAMLAKDPAHRPTLAQVRRVVADVRATEGQRAATEFVAPRAARPARRRTLAIGAAALVLGIAGGAIVTARAMGPTTADPPRAEVPRAPELSVAPPPSPPPPQASPPPQDVGSAHTRTPVVPERPRPRAGSGSPHPEASHDVAPRSEVPHDAALAPHDASPHVDLNGTVNPFAKRQERP